MIVARTRHLQGRDRDVDAFRPIRTAPGVRLYAVADASGLQRKLLSTASYGRSLCLVGVYETHKGDRSFTR